MKIKKLYSTKTDKEVLFALAIVSVFNLLTLTFR